MVIGSVKSIWTKPSETSHVVDQLTNTFLEEARLKNDVTLALVSGLVQANEGLVQANADTLERLLHVCLNETLPLLANETRSHGRNFVRPVGDTCSKIVQFPGTPFESSISESEADVIRGDTAMEVDPMAEFKVTHISEVDIRTGHCVIDVEGINSQLIGKITDPVLETPGNVYTNALNNHTGFLASAKAVRKNGDIKRLYISNSVEI